MNEHAEQLTAVYEIKEGGARNRDRYQRKYVEGFRRQLIH
jgi:hypothetical protein